jgi:hypothetical protein
MLYMRHEDISTADPDVHDALQKEADRQESEALEMIASENFVPGQVLQAQGSLMMNKDVKTGFCESNTMMLVRSQPPQILDLPRELSL